MKRGESGLSLIVAVEKPRGMSSHDVVNRVRRVFGERRVGHTGTLDPMATGVLPVCVGPATRLDKYMTGHDKSYLVDIAFGCETTTDDAEGEPTETGIPGSDLYDEEFARTYLQGILGVREQVPPSYSAVKVDGKRAYQLARSGKEADLEPRAIEVYEADLAGCLVDEETGFLTWSVFLSVSKGTYIRALARDIGREVGCPAHVAALQRRQAGLINLKDCVSLETLESIGLQAALDPVAVLGYRYAFGDGVSSAVGVGSKLAGDALQLNEPLPMLSQERFCACAGNVVKSDREPENGEIVCVVVENRVKALYEYRGDEGCWTPACVFAIGIIRG